MNNVVNNVAELFDSFQNCENQPYEIVCEYRSDTVMNFQVIVLLLYCAHQVRRFGEDLKVLSLYFTRERSPENTLSTRQKISWFKNSNQRLGRTSSGSTSFNPSDP